MPGRPAATRSPPSTETKWLLRESEAIERDHIHSHPAARGENPPRPGRAPAARAAGRSPLGSPGAARVARADRPAVPVGPGQERLGERLLRGRGPGRHEELEGVLLRLVRPVQLHYRGQDTGLAVGDGAVRADIRLQPVVNAGTAGAGG